ncbi:MAG: succinylglutamate desuccinylase/aspartoacylase family protein [Bacteriovoracaceae bacterium]|nr:succinylglutamate desuccinylase/aspartoacylase family protein [Bacteriovoracaceae bacterium]
MIALLKLKNWGSLCGALFFVLSHSAQAITWQERYSNYKTEIDLLKPLQGCQSRGGEWILHFNKEGKSGGKKILVLSLIHGNEIPSGDVGFRWIKRLAKLSPSNSWLIIPVANPDAVNSLSRTNKSGIDLNRHFPTKDWDEEAHKYWKKLGSAANKFPGDKAGSEPEVACLVGIINNYQPDLVVSVHTPFAVLDFDGPENKKPHTFPLRWKRLGNYPGSLGRYAWAERQIPVLTVEIPERASEELLKKIDRFQDELSYLAK